jgi:radical SAM superfamily enzyme YgiQ (UPF0313 family)
MRLSLIQTPVEDFYYTPQRSYPLGLTYLAAACRTLPVKVEIIDLISSHGRRTVPVPDVLRPVTQYYPYDRSPISAFHNYFRFGASPEWIRKYFSEHFYDICALSSNFYTYIEELVETARIIKEVSPRSIIIVGGQNTGPGHDLLTFSPYIDHCLSGEAEESFVRLIRALINGEKDISDIPGIWDPLSRKWNKPSIKTDFSFSPDIKSLPSDHCHIAGKPAIQLSTSRGCPMNCRFCSVSQTFGKTMRLKPVQMVIDEMQKAYDHGIRAFDIEDDNFTFDRSHCVGLLKEINRNFKNVIDIYAMNGLSTEHLDEEIIDLLICANLKLLNISLATSSVERLALLERKTNTEHFADIAHYAGRKKLKTMGHFIVGLPEQTVPEMIESMRFLAGFPLLLGISPFYYVPGIDMKMQNTPLSCKEARLTRFFPADDLFTEKDLITLFRLSRWINYVKKQLDQNKIKTICYKDLSRRFNDDLFIRKLTDEKRLAGIDKKNNIYYHDISETVIDLFTECMRESFIHCA